MNQTDNMKNVSNSKENNLQADVVIVGTGVGRLLFSPESVRRFIHYYDYKIRS